jgi:hypothetical protein
MYQMDNESIKHFRYNEITNRYELVESSENHVLEMIREKYKETSFIQQMGWNAKVE